MQGKLRFLFIVICLLSIGVKGITSWSAFEYVFNIHNSPFLFSIPFLAIVSIHFGCKHISTIYLVFSVAHILFLQLYDLSPVNDVDDVSGYELFEFSPKYIIIYFIIYLLISKIEDHNNTNFLKDLKAVISGEDYRDNIKSDFMKLHSQYRHDVRNMLTSIYGYSDLIIGMATQGNTIKIIEYCEKLTERIDKYVTKTKVKNKLVCEIINEAPRFALDLVIQSDKSIKFNGDESILSDVFTNFIKNSQEANSSQITFIIRDKKIYINDNGDPIDPLIIKNKRKTTKQGDQRGYGLESIRRKLDTIGATLKIDGNALNKFTIQF